MDEAGWYVLVLYSAPQIGLHELIVIQLMEMIRRVYTRQPRRPKSARAANHTIHHLVQFENEPTTLEQRSYKSSGMPPFPFRRFSPHASCSSSSLSLSLLSPALVLLSPLPPHQLPKLVRHPDPPALICSLCHPIFQSFNLFFLSTSLGINGSGCPPGSAIYTLSSEFPLQSIVRSSLIVSLTQPINLLLPSPSVNTSPKQGQEFLSATIARIAK